MGAAGGVRRGDAVRGLPRRDASETRRRIRRRSIAPWIDRQPAGAATRRTGPDATDRRIRRELIRVTNAPDLAKQGWRPNAVEVSGSGLRPEGVLVYDERSQGRVAGPSAKVSQPRQIGRTLVSHDTLARSRSPMNCRGGFLTHRLPCAPPVADPSEWPVGQRIFERGIPLIPWLPSRRARSIRVL